ncbi:MAG: peptide deformylase [Oscillospiraceae bacterium]|nr:peptide deformylase [Oscillospiraceae bacterium]
MTVHTYIEGSRFGTMALRRVVMFGEDTLRKTSRKVEVFDDKLWVLLDDMQQTMDQFGGVGLASPQVGILRRVIVVEDSDTEKRVELVNPVITKEVGQQREVEGCLSSPGEWGYVKRPERISLTASNRYGKEFQLDAKGVFAITICHEIDHLNGKLFTDLADEMVEDEEELEKAKRSRNRKCKRKKKRR